MSTGRKKNFVIYDGPGYRFNFLNKYGGKSRFVSSTFQCLLQFLLTYLFQWELNDIFYYSLAFNDNEVLKRYYPTSEILIHIPFSNCLSNFCVHHFAQPEGFYLNVTVLNLNVTSSETSHCLFQGLFLGEIWDNNFLAIDVLCSDFKTHSGTSLSSYYTRGSSLFLVLYWYKSYTLITATILVNITKCPAVHLNICKYYHYCSYETPEMFYHFMKTVTHNSRLKFNNCYDHLLRIGFDLPQGECVFLVLFDKFNPFKELNSYKLLNTCKFILSSKWGKNKINYIDGFLGDRNFLETVAHKDCFSSNHPMCHTILNDQNVQEFHKIKFINKFKQYLTDEIDIALVEINSRQTRSLVNILLLGLSRRRKKKQYGLTAHQPGLKISDLMFSVALSTSWALGLDWILSIDRNITLGPQHRNAVSCFTIQRRLDVLFDLLKKWILIHIGKS